MLCPPALLHFSVQYLTMFYFRIKAAGTLKSSTTDETERKYCVVTCTDQDRCRLTAVYHRTVLLPLILLGKSTAFFPFRPRLFWVEKQGYSQLWLKTGRSSSHSFSKTATQTKGRMSLVNIRKGYTVGGGDKLLFQVFLRNGTSPPWVASP